MSKLAHSDDATMQRIESDRMLRDDPTLFRCCGCGLVSPDEWKPCDCPTGCGYRVIKGAMEMIVFKRADPDSVVAYLREVDAGRDNACWVVCAKGDPGAVAFQPI